jgi:hypothetical protein
MKLPQTGGCQCGAIRYEISVTPQLVYTCHCTDCQGMISSAFSMGLVIADRAFRLTGTEPRLSSEPRTVGHGASVGSARTAVRGSAPRQDRARPPERCGPVHWTTHLGCARPCISGSAASSPGSYCPKATRRSGPSRRTSAGMRAAPAGNPGKTVEDRSRAMPAPQRGRPRNGTGQVTGRHRDYSQAAVTGSAATGKAQHRMTFEQIRTIGRRCGSQSGVMRSS